jgi:hypothetical protein
MGRGVAIAGASSFPLDAVHLLLSVIRRQWVLVLLNVRLTCERSELLQR